MINVFVIDDHPVFINGIQAIFIDGKDKIKVTGMANSADEALPKLRRSYAKIVLLDLVMPGLSGVELCAVIKTQFPDKKVIVLTGELNPTILYNTWINKADAILMKYCGKDEMVQTIHAVLDGRRVIGNDVPEFYENLRIDGKKTLKLTRREQQIINLLAKGIERKVIGEMLGSTSDAVNFHCHNIFKKFKKTKLVSVVDEARRQGFIV